MPVFKSDIADIAYIDEGEGEPILLIHGFASNKSVNWVNPGWVDLLVKDGRRVIALDNRGHGESGKFYDPADYGAPMMAEDARRLLDHLGLSSVMSWAIPWARASPPFWRSIIRTGCAGQSSAAWAMA